MTTIWRDVPVPIVVKETHVRRVGGRLRRGFVRTLGDVPVARHNGATGRFEEVVNLRGLAYGARKRLGHRRKKR